jgi:hypothetical protein
MIGRLGWVLPLSLLLAASDPFDTGLLAYREGRFAEALRAFSEAVDAAGEEASPALLYDQALAALRSGALGEAEAAANRAAARGGPDFAARSDFVRANVAFTKCEWTEKQADHPAAPPFALDSAIRYAETARDLWASAAMSRPDWPEARRNVERALLKLEALREKKARAQEPPRKEPEKKPEPRPLPPEPEGPLAEEETSIEPRLEDLTAEEVMRLLDKLEEKEQEKLEMRRARRSRQPVEVERDW